MHWLLVVVVGVVVPPPQWSNGTMQARHMRRCIALAKQAVAEGGAPYGALIADPTTGAVVAEGRNHAGVNPIWHGEMDAITRLAAGVRYHIVIRNT